MTHTSIRLFALLMLAFASRAYALYDPAREYVETPAVGARYPERAGEIGGHLFIVEFERPFTGDEVARFAAAIDRDLIQRNLDYQAHRAGGFGLRPPAITVLRAGGFAEWMRRRGRLGSQNKVPRVIADPELFADLRGFAAEFSDRRSGPRHP